MATTTQIYSLEDFNAYAQAYIEDGIVSSLFNRSVILSVLAGVGGMEGELGRPGAYTIMGGAGMSEAQRRKTMGSVRAHAFFLTEEVGGGKWIGARGTSSNTGNTSQDQKKKSASFCWAEREDPIKVWKDTLKMAQGEWEIAEPLDEATNFATEEHYKAISTGCYTGNPSDQQEDKWDALLGLQQMCHTTNTYGNVNRSTYSAWASNRVTTSKAASLDLIDDAHLDYDGSGSNLLDNGPGADLWLTTGTIYRKLKRQAKAEGVSIVKGSIADHGMLGYVNEWIEYGDKIVAYDPYCPSGHMFGLCTKSLVFEIHPESNFTVEEFVDQGVVNPGGDKAMTSSICTWMRFWTTAPHHHLVFTDVS